MNTAIFFLPIGAIVGAVGWRTQNSTLGQWIETRADKTRGTACDTIGRAITLALATGGEHRAVAQLVVRS